MNKGEVNKIEDLSNLKKILPNLLWKALQDPEIPDEDIKKLTELSGCIKMSDNQYAMPPNFDPDEWYTRKFQAFLRTLQNAKSKTHSTHTSHESR